MRKESNNLDPEVRLGKRKPSKAKPEKSKALFAAQFKVASSFKAVVQGGGGRSRGRGKSQGKSSVPARADRKSMQRCAIRASYADNKGNGTWAAHGRYIERDSAQYSRDESHELSFEGLENVEQSRAGLYQRGYSDAPVIGSESGYLTENDLHSVSEFNVVDRQAGAAMLLPSDSPHDMDRFAEAYAARLRRVRAGDRATPSTPGASRARAVGRSHGRLPLRERHGTVRRERVIDAVFGSEGSSDSAFKTLRQWESSGDPRIFKFIISPEFGERVDHRRLTTDLFKRIEQDMGVGLQWVAITHYNTDHPHTHVALRGVTTDGQELRFSRQYLSHTIRQHAQAELTRQIGYRTQFDMAEAARREVWATRLTSLDRTLLAAKSHLPPSGSWKPVGPLPNTPIRTQLVQRLEALEAMGQARKSLGTWYLSGGLRGALTAMQRATDRQRALRDGQLAVSDSRLPLVVTPIARLRGVQGRILGHGQEEGNGRSYMLLESTAGKVKYIYHNSDLAELRRQHGLKPGDYAAFKVRWQSERGRWRPVLEVEQWGDAERLLKDPRYLRQAAPVADGTPAYGGWLGRRNEAVREFQRQSRKLQRALQSQER